ncbi:MAG: hypothetical protein ACLQPD_21725 [Desulfomonilaceae bacterium]
MTGKQYSLGWQKALQFPLIQALLGRRSRRFMLGATIPAGPLAFNSAQTPVPLDEPEKIMILTAMAGNTDWHYAHMYNAHYAPHLPNYAGTANGRTFPSAAGFHTSEIFFTDDEGIYFFETRDAPAPIDCSDDETQWDIEALIAIHRKRIMKISDNRLHMPSREPHISGHNTWIVNRSGSLLVIPVADVAQHQIANLCYYLQNGYALYDDINKTPIPGLDRYRDLYDETDLLPLSIVEQDSLLESTTELVLSCYAGTLILQAMGLGGWMFNGMNPGSVLGASGDPEIPGLGFRYDRDERWLLPNPTGLPNVFEGFCPPHYPDMRAAVEAFVRRKFGPGGPFHPDTPGAWKDSPSVRGSAQAHSDEFKECVALQAQYTFDRFGKFPGTTPSILAFIYLQAHHLDLEFYDHYFKPGSYLKTHAEHFTDWHKH